MTRDWPKVASVLLLAAVLPQRRAAGGNVDELADRSDAVVVAEVRSGHQIGASAGFSLTVVRAIKGPFAAGDSVAVSWSTTLRAEKDLAGNYGLWFLKEGGDRLWHLLTVLPGRVPFESAYFKLPRVTPMDMHSKSTPAGAIDLVAREFAAGLSSNNGASYDLATALLGVDRCSECAAIFGTFRLSAEPELRFVGLAGMVTRSDWSALGEIASGMDELRHLDVGPYVVGDAVGRIRTGDPDAIRMLGSIALSAGSGFREGAGVQKRAAIALASIHTRDTLAFLSRLLDSADSLVQYEAMLGMSRFVDNLPIEMPGTVANGRSAVPQGPAPYRTSETARHSPPYSLLTVGSNEEPRYVQFWKSWWEKMKNELGLGNR